MTKEKLKKYLKALEFLDNHPALSKRHSDFIKSNLDIWVEADGTYNGGWSILKFNKKSEFSTGNITKWFAYIGWEGGEVNAKTFEDLIIKLSQVIKKELGDFKRDDFLTEKEIYNHKKERPYHRLKEGKFNKLVQNPKYIEVGSEVLNLRWWNQWFRKTKRGKGCTYE